MELILSKFSAREYKSQTQKIFIGFTPTKEQTERKTDSKFSKLSQIITG